MINNINKLSETQFIKLFANIFENSQSIAGDLYKKKGDGFNDFDDLTKKMMDIFDNTTKEQKLKILNSHPDLANKTKVSSLTDDSKKEQQNAGLDSCTKEEFDKFKKLNDLYKKKFNFPFIYAVKGKSKTEILNNFRQRISYDINVEFNEALKNTKKIAIQRLNEINKK